MPQLAKLYEARRIIQSVIGAKFRSFSDMSDAVIVLPDELET